ncbi:hypothetical protein [Deinococcus puniceus]|uniref:Uncharacterized protein n=1 Tax=Deinococcus puniceus TaxID=1182568 RepID=A0A172T9N3_9DEIO|nr:hypothetical protein [Deinococcus puniceus]ANE43738.1 hypothetical protein SU48_08115 [Deinococcus puniceus]
MKILTHLKLSGAMLGLTVLLTACPGVTPPVTTFDLTVALAGVSSAPVTVINTTTGAELFKGTLDASKTFAGLTANDVLKIEGGNVAGYTTPAAQTVTLDASKTVTLTYVKPTPAPTYDLTVNLSGVSSAPVTVTNTATNAEVFKGTLNASKTFTGLPANSVLKVEGGAVADYAAPAAQTVTLDASKYVSLTYTALAGAALEAARVVGTIPGWTAGAGKIGFFMTNARATVDGTPNTISASGSLNAALPTPTTLRLFLSGCTLSAGTTGGDFQSEFANPSAYSAAGDFLGGLTETTTAGVPVTRVYAQTATTLKGIAMCGSANRLDLDLTVSVGWNALSIVRTDAGGVATFTIRNVPSDARIQLGFVPALPSVRLNPTDYSTVVLGAGTSVTREITFTPTGTVSGSIDLSTSVPGVKVTPSTINLSGTSSLSAQSAQGSSLIQQALKPQALTTTVTFSLTDQATDYSGPLALIASQGGTELGRTQLPASIRLPSVNVYVANVMTGVDAYQGGSASVSVNVSPQEGFSGNVTLNLTGLPAGVTASPVTVNVNANATTTVAIPMQVAADAPLGITQVKVTGDKVPVNNNGMPNVFQLSIKPARTSLGTLAYNTLAPASNGVWVISGYNYANGGFQATLRRIANGQNVKEVTLGDVSNFLLAIPGGDVYAIGTDFRNSNIIYRVKDDGTSSALTTTTTAGMSNGVVDDQGRIWFVATLDGSTGASTYGLFQWNPVTGARTLVDGSRTYTPNNRLVVSNNGLYVLYGPEYNGTPILINTSTSVASPVANPSGNSIDSAAVSNTGQVWYSSNGGLTRINSDGTATTFTVSGGSVSRITGFDQNNANTLWATGYNSSIKVDAVSGTTSLIPTDSIERSVVNTKGGVSILASGRPTGSGLEYFLSVLP